MSTGLLSDHASRCVDRLPRDDTTIRFFAEGYPVGGELLGIVTLSLGYPMLSAEVSRGIPQVIVPREVNRIFTVVPYGHGYTVPRSSDDQ